MKHNNSDYDLFEIDRKRFTNSTIVEGTITSIDYNSHLATVEYAAVSECSGFPTTEVPFYYYCQDGSKDNGDTAFVIGDKVEIIRLRYLSPTHPEFSVENDEYYILGHSDRWDVVPCKGETIVIRAFGSYNIGEDSRVAGGSWVTIIDAISGRKREDLGFNFPCKSTDPDFLTWAACVSLIDPVPFWTYYNYWYDAAYDPVMSSIGNWSVGYVGVSQLQSSDITWPAVESSTWSDGANEILETYIDNPPIGPGGLDFYLVGGLVDMGSSSHLSPSVYGGNDDGSSIFCCGLYPLGSDEIVGSIESEHTYSKEITQTFSREMLYVAPWTSTLLLNGNTVTTTSKESYYKYSRGTYSSGASPNKLLSHYKPSENSVYFLKNEITIKQTYTVERDDIGDYYIDVGETNVTGYPSGYWQRSTLEVEDSLISCPPYSNVPFVNDTFNAIQVVTLTYPRVGDVTWEASYQGPTFSNGDTYSGTYGINAVFLSSYNFSSGANGVYCISAIAVRNIGCIDIEASGIYPISINDSDATFNFEDIAVYADMGVASIPVGGVENVAIADFSHRNNSDNLAASIKELLVLQQRDRRNSITELAWNSMTIDQKRALMNTVYYIDAFPVNYTEWSE